MVYTNCRELCIVAKTKLREYAARTMERGEEMDFLVSAICLFPDEIRLHL